MSRAQRHCHHPAYTCISILHCNMNTKSSARRNGCAKFPFFIFICFFFFFSSSWFQRLFVCLFYCFDFRLCMLVFSFGVGAMILILLLFVLSPSSNNIYAFYFRRRRCRHVSCRGSSILQMYLFYIFFRKYFAVSSTHFISSALFKHRQTYTHCCCTNKKFASNCHHQCYTLIRSMSLFCSVTQILLSLSIRVHFVFRR